MTRVAGRKRYKVLVSMHSDKYGEVFSPLPRYLQPAVIGREWNALCEKYHMESVHEDGTKTVYIAAGIPVLCTPEAARAYLRSLMKHGCYQEYRLVVAEVLVSGLLYKGSVKLDGRRYKTEAWNKIRVLRVIDSDSSMQKTA